MTAKRFVRCVDNWRCNKRYVLQLVVVLQLLYFTLQEIGVPLLLIMSVLLMFKLLVRVIILWCNNSVYDVFQAIKST